MKEAARSNRQSARNLMRYRQWPNRTIAYCLFSLFFNASLVQAQPIEAASDGTGTLITPDGNSFNITGGSTSKDGANLFHSFSQFGLSAGEIANFQSNPAIVNILSRVTGGNTSYINGLIQVTGGNSNLFLMNPAGMVFGPNASLNVPASFIATTANGIGFGSLWFNAAEVSDYAALIGTPSAFAFTMPQPAAIINFGNLAVEPGQNIALLAGSIISSGTLSAPGGQITLVAVPGESVVRISQPGHLLSLDVPPQPSALPIPSLPELLTGSSGSHATALTVNPDGTVQLTGSGFRVENGDIVAQNLTAGTATLAANRNLTLVESALKTTGDLRLLARDTVQIRDSLNNPFIAQAGGNLYIQGNRAIDIFALNHPETPFQSGGNLTLVSDGIISGDAHFSSARTFSILNSLGGGGNFISLYDPIISSEGDVVFGDYVGASLKIEAKGSIIGGNITITSPDTAIVGSDPDIPILTSQPALILRAGVDKLQNPPNVPPDLGTAANELYSNDFEGSVGDEWSNNKTETTPEGSRNFLGQFNNDTVSLSLENLPTHTGATVSFDLFIIGSWDGNSTDWGPDIWDLSIPDGRTLLRTTFGNYNPLFDGYVTSQSYPSGYNSSTPIDNESRLGASENNSLGYLFGEKTIDSVYNLSFTFPHANSSLGLKFSASNLQEISDESWGLDNVRLSLMENYFTSLGGPSGGSIQVGNISTAGGPIILDARSHIQTGSITSNGGFIDLTSKIGNIDITSILDTTAIIGNSGNITLNAPGNITTSSMSAGASNGNGGNISINTTAGTITNTGTIDSSATNGNAGNITLAALSDIFTANITAKASEGAGGNISITSSAGIIKTTAGTIDSSATNGNAGNITLNGLGDIFTGNILTETTYGLSGDIYINSEAGNIITGELLSRTKDNLPGNGGNITLKAKGDIDTNVIFSYTGEGNGGNVSLTSLFSDIDTAGVVAGTGEGNGGAITLNAKRNITAGGLISGAVTGQGGNIKLETSSGNITLTESLLNNYFGKPENIEKLQGTHQFGSDGSITFTPTNTTTLEGEQGSFGTVTFVGPTNLTINVPAPEPTPSPTPMPASAPEPTPTPSPTSASAPEPTPTPSPTSVPASTPEPTPTPSPTSASAPEPTPIPTSVPTVSTTPTPVSVPTDTPTISAPAAPVISPPPSPDQSKISVSPNGIVSGSVKGNAGSIIINGINVHTGDIINPALQKGNGGNISATTVNLETGNLNTSANQGNAGNVDLTAQNDITTSQINTTSQQGNAGNVSATTPGGNIKTADIDASTQVGNGGDVILKAQGDISTNQIDTSSQKKNAGNIFLTSLAGNVNTSSLLANSERGKDGRISLIHFGDLKTGELHSDKIFKIDTSRLLNPFSTDVDGRGGNPKASEEINQTATNPPINFPASRSDIEEIFRRTPQRNEPSISASAVSRSELSSTLAQGNIEQGVLQIEEVWTQEFSDSLKEKIPEVMSFSSIREMLGTIENQIGIKPGVIYAVSLPDQLQLILVTPGNKPIIKSIPEANREKLRDIVKQFSHEINDIKQTSLAASQQLYKLLITPLENELKTQGIKSLMFSLDAGLRTIPLAALHDGKEFLIQKYSISLIPSVSYTDVSYKGIQNSQVLAMGRSEFSDPRQEALPAVPIELLIAVKDRLQSKFLLNEAFTLENLKTQRRQQPFGIIHLATHADFQSNSEQAASTYVQLWDRKLQLDEMRQVKWYAQPTVELLVLSACRTAIGDEKAEMGFAGLAVQAGVKSALASLWKVNDVGTLALMSEFYRHLGSAPIKAEALRQAQLAMLHERAIVKDSQLRDFSSGIEIALPAELGHWNEQKLSHPYYWAAFTIIGSPW